MKLERCCSTEKNCGSASTIFLRRPIIGSFVLYCFVQFLPTCTTTSCGRETTTATIQTCDIHNKGFGTANKKLDSAFVIGTLLVIYAPNNRRVRRTFSLPYISFNMSSELSVTLISFPLPTGFQRKKQFNADLYSSVSFPVKTTILGVSGLCTCWSDLRHRIPLNRNSHVFRIELIIIMDWIKLNVIWNITIHI